MVIKSLQQRVQHEAYLLVVGQLLCISILALITFLCFGKTPGVSVFVGGMAYGLPNLVFVWRVFRYTGAQQTSQFMLAFYLGELLKLVLSAVLILMIVKYLPVSLLSVLIGFIIAIVSFWIVCVWHFSKQKTAHKR